MPWKGTLQDIYLNQQSINPDTLAEPYDIGGIIKVPKTSK